LGARPSTQSTRFARHQPRTCGAKYGAQQDLDPGPSRADRADRADEATLESANLTPARALARPQQRGLEAALAVEHNDRLEPVIVVIGVEQPQLLLAMNPVEGVVDIEDDALRHHGGCAASGDRQVQSGQPNHTLDQCLALYPPALMHRSG